MKRKIALIFCSLVIAAHLTALEKQQDVNFCESTYQKYLDSHHKFLLVNNVPQDFNDRCLGRLDLFPEKVSGASHDFYFTAASAYAAMSVYHPERAQNCQLIARYYQAIVLLAFKSNIDAITAREIVNKDEKMLGFIYYGEHKLIKLDQWHREWTAIKKQVDPGYGDLQELSS
ncbi:hypothetical protein BH09DEP1_BH09DEP1_4010 [soil metagenome]